MSSNEEGNRASQNSSKSRVQHDKQFVEVNPSILPD